MLDPWMRWIHIVGLFLATNHHIKDQTKTAVGVPIIGSQQMVQGQIQIGETNKTKGLLKTSQINGSWKIISHVL